MLWLWTGFGRLDTSDPCRPNLNGSCHSSVVNSNEEAIFPITLASGPHAVAGLPISPWSLYSKRTFGEAGSTDGLNQMTPRAKTSAEIAQAAANTAIRRLDGASSAA